MELEKALKIARREWGNLKVSLERAGDIGEFDSKSLVNSRLALVQIETGDKFPTYKHSNQSSLLIKSLIEMENKLTKYGYVTQEAGYVFKNLASNAAERLGLVRKLAETFGGGYSWVRTGWFFPSDTEKQTILQQLFFFKIFFPLGVRFDWDFNSQAVKTKLDLVSHKFFKWQDDPGTYSKDARDSEDVLKPLWHGLSPNPGFSPFDNDIEYQNLEDVLNWV
jgi:hypothetical protein